MVACRGCARSLAGTDGLFSHPQNKLECLAKMGMCEQSEWFKKETELWAPKVTFACSCGRTFETEHGKNDHEWGCGLGEAQKAKKYEEERANDKKKWWKDMEEAGAFNLPKKTSDFVRVD